MRPTSARTLLAALSVIALAAGVLTSKVIFFVAALGAGFLLGTSLSTSRRPLTRALDGFRDHVVEVRLWGAPPPDFSGATLVVASVNVLGAGAHVFFRRHDGGSLHLKVAQPHDHSLAPGRVVIGSARYVQWNGKRLPRAGSAPAVVIALSETASDHDQSGLRSRSEHVCTDIAGPPAL
jgi:hypothetical protein